MKYYEGDIVEIITAKYKSWSDIPRHERGYFENQEEPAPTVGQRFRVYFISENSISAKTPRGLPCLSIHPDCVMLYKRSFRNKIRALFTK